jgi:hypothetical protein
VKLLKNRLPGWAEGMNALVAGLQRTGCLAETEYMGAEFFGNIPLAVTPFGHHCLETIRSEANSLLEHQ